MKKNVRFWDGVGKTLFIQQFCEADEVLPKVGALRDVIYSYLLYDLFWASAPPFVLLWIPLSH